MHPKNEIKKAIILATPTIDSTSGEVKPGDLIQIDNDYDNSLYIIDHINPRFLKRANDPDNPYKYFVKDDRGELLNYSRDEFRKCNIAFFDYNKWDKERIKIFLGHVNAFDLEHIKCKKLNEYEWGYADINKLTLKDLDGMEFDGYQEKKQIIEDSDPNMPVASIIHYFRVFKY